MAHLTYKIDSCTKKNILTFKITHIFWIFLPQFSASPPIQAQTKPLNKNKLQNKKKRIMRPI